jgi:hypothetical protein
VLSLVWVCGVGGWRRFEYAPEDEARFDELLKRLRDTPEWSYVTHEVDVRLERRQQ